MGFEFEKLRVPSVSVEFKPTDDLADGEGVLMEVNANLLNFTQMEEIEEDFNKTFLDLQELAAPVKKSGKKQKPEEPPTKPVEKIQMFVFEKINIKFRARMLGGKPGAKDDFDRLIKSWNVTQNGAPVPVCYETFLAMPQNALNALYDFVTNDAIAVKKTK